MEAISNAKFEDIIQAISTLVIYQNKKDAQARKEAFSRFPVSTVSAFLAMEKKLSDQDGSRSDAVGTY